MSPTADAAWWGDRAGCGPRIAKSTGGYWQCTFADNFRGRSVDPYKWVAQRTDKTGFKSGLTACFVASPNNIWVSDGTLKLTTRKEPSPFTCKDPHGDWETQYTGAMVSTAGRFSQAYGRFEYRARLLWGHGNGLQSALWLYPAQLTYGAWPASGEIDVAEMYSAHPDRAIPFVHYNTAGADATVTNNECMIANPSAFHRYVAEWSRESIKIIYDGRTCLEHRFNPSPPLRSPQPFDRPFMVVMSQGLGVNQNAFDPATTPLPATTEVDYVRVWR